MSRRTGWLVLAVLAGFTGAIVVFRRAYRRREAVVYTNVPPSARPRYIVYGDAYDPYSTWPYGTGSSYGIVAGISNGAPTSVVAGGAGRSVATGPGNSIYGGGGGGIAAGASLGGGFRGG